MLNNIEAYTETGTKAAKAMNQRDAACYDFHKRWLTQALALESDDDKVKARAAYDEAYKAARNVPQFYLG